MADTTTTIDLAEILAVDREQARKTGADRFGVTEGGFAAKPFGQLLAEKVALAQEVFGADLDLTAGSVIRKILELTALEDARTWAALSSMYDSQFVATATGDALSRLGEELGFSRPFQRAGGRIELTLVGPLADPQGSVRIPRGARLLTAGGHHVATEESVVLSAARKQARVGVKAFYPGPEHNLDPSQPGQAIVRWNELDQALSGLLAARDAASAASGQAMELEQVVSVKHTTALTGGEQLWPDVRYRELLLRAPRSVWTVEAIEIALSRVPGVRQVQVRDAWGGLDLYQSLFGNFNFIERLFGAERDVGSPYYFTVLIAPTPEAIWGGPDGLRAAVEAAMEDLRPVGIFPQVVQAEEVGIGVAAELVVRGLPLPSGSRAVVNGSQAAGALKARLLERVRRYVDGLRFGEPVRASEVTWALMNEPGIADATGLELVRYPPAFDALDLGAAVPSGQLERLGCGKNANLQGNQIAVLIDDPELLVIT